MKLSRSENIQVTDSSNAATTVITSTGGVYVNGLTLGYKEDGSTASNLTANGISVLPYTSAANTFTIDAPVVGVEKIVALKSTAVADSTAIAISVYTGSTAILINDDSTTYAPKLYINFLPPFGSVKLVGLTTAEWGVLGTYGAVQLTTAAGYTT
jgi:hypothetical protein